LGARGAASPFEVVAIGNIRPAKDYATLIRAIGILRDRGMSLRMRIAGQPDQQGLYEELNALTSALGLDAMVSFLGFVADPTALLAESDLFVLSSKAEGFSLAIVEAMLAGTPIVATASGGPESIIRSGVTGILTAVGSPDALADSMATLLRDPREADRLAIAAQLDATQRFTIDGAVDAYVQLYESALRR
jgi:glycosyltransferase involved in cell wall biosynthesis